MALIRWKTELNLEESQRKYQLLMKHLPSIVWAATSDGKIKFISSNIESIYGFTPNEIYQKGIDFWFERIHPDDVNEVNKRKTLLFTNNTPYDVIYRIKNKFRH